jgi:hypothetical protein
LSSNPCNRADIPGDGPPPNSFASATCVPLSLNPCSFIYFRAQEGGGTPITVNLEREMCALLSPIISTLTGAAPVRPFRTNTYAYPGVGGTPSAQSLPIDPLSRSFYHARCGAIWAFPGWSYVHA